MHWILPGLAIAASQACGNSCFGGGTWISLARGRKRLRDVKVGDVVRSFDVASGELALRPVLRVFRHGPKPVGQLLSAPGAGPRSVTSNHPIFVEPLGDFAPAGTLDREHGKRRGLYWDERDLRCIELEPYRLGPAGHVLEVYNLAIEETETYFADGLLVHNKSYPYYCEDQPSGCPSGGASAVGGSSGSGGLLLGVGGEPASGGVSSDGDAGAAGSAGDQGAAGSAGSEP